MRGIIVKPCFSLLYLQYLLRARIKEPSENYIRIRDQRKKICDLYMGQVSSQEKAGTPINRKEIMATAVGVMKADAYYELLYPNHTALKGYEAMKAVRDHAFIEKNIDEIDSLYIAGMQKGCFGQQLGVFTDEQSILAAAVRDVRARIYFKTLYPQYDSLTPNELREAHSNEDFLYNHIDQIDERVYLENAAGNREAILKIIRDMRPKFPTNVIGSATLNSSVKQKIRANSVEQNNTQPSKGVDFDD